VSGEKPPAVLLGGDETAVPIARSLGRAGVTVHALGKRSDPVRRSRHCAEFVDLGTGEGLQDRWLEWLVRSAKPGSVVLPCSDEGLELVARNRAALVARDLVPIEADDAKLLDMLDKERTHELAIQHGIPVPRTMTVHDREELAQAVEEIGFPCALKPLQAHKFRRHFTIKGFVADDRADLEEFFRMSEAAGVEMLVTEMVRGPDQYHSAYTYLDERGEPLFTFTKQKLRQYPITFGAGVYHIMDWNEEVSDLGMRFCRSVGLRGLLNVEFKRDSRDGRLMLIECNHRFTASSALHLAAGLDVPLFTYNRLIGAPLPRLGRPYKEGIALWYPLDDFRAFKAYRRAGEMTAFAYVRSLMRPQHFSIASPSDPAPLLVALKPRFTGLWRRVLRKLALRRAEVAPALEPAAEPVEKVEPRTPAGTRG
jgi:predicted ATP-grasp superfamily ATP-dependent carboligase